MRINNPSKKFSKEYSLINRFGKDSNKTNNFWLNRNIWKKNKPSFYK